MGADRDTAEGTTSAVEETPAVEEKSTDTAKRRAGAVVVGIGASAGGLEALREFVSKLEPNGVLTYVIAQHLSPNHRSLLSEILDRETDLPVKEVTRAQLPRPDTIYVVPPNKNMEVESGYLRVAAPNRRTGPQPSVDLFFASLALEYGEEAIGIVLSGTGSDGARGIQAIKAAGGITFSQDDTAKYDGMPHAARATGCVDLILPPAQMAERLPRLLDQTRAEALDANGGFATDTYEEILAVLRSRHQVDFSDYRATTVLRRIQRRLTVLQLDDLEAYLAHLKQEASESERLQRELLIGVTSFFRDPKAYEDLARAVQDIVQNKQPGEEIRVWVPACSSGEEAYSIAILILEAMRKNGCMSRLQIFASDLDGDALIVGRQGSYPPSAAQHIKPGLLRRYFTVAGGNYVVRNELRDALVFTKHNVIEDPPFSKLDLVSCRNLLIYLNPPLQRRVLERFHYALRPGAYLYLGKSESAGDQNDLFSIIDRESKIFRSVAGAISPFRPTRYTPSRDISTVRPRGTKRTSKDRESYALEAIAKTYGPPTIIVDQTDRPVHISGRVAPYLKIPTGQVQFDIWNLVRGEMRAELRALLTRCRRDGVAVRSRLYQTEHEGDSWDYRIEVNSYRDPDVGEDLSLIAFITTRVHVEDEELVGKSAEQAVEDHRVEELEHELASMREHLQTLVEELETSNEELQSLNEELQSSNEELQSTNEELETSNEELQSTNEELTTVNEEIAFKSEALHEANSFLSDILENLGHAVIVTDPKFNVLRINSAASDLFEVTEADIGQSITALRPRHRMPDLRLLVDRAVTKRKTSARRIRAGSASYQLQVHPCVDDQDVLLGAIVAFNNVTSLVEANSRLRESERELSRLTETQTAILNSLPAHISLIDPKGNIIAVNEEWNRFAKENGYGHTECGLGTNYLEICETARGDGAEQAPLVGARLRALLQGRLNQFEVRYPCHAPKEHRWFRCIGRPVVAGETRFGAVIMHVDETEQVVAEDSIRAARDMAQEANEAKSRFLANMSHELRTPLNAILGFSEMQKSELYGPLGSPKYMEYASDIHSEGRRLLEMISQILDLSKVEAGKLDMNEVTVDIRACQKTIFKEVRETARQKKIALSVQFARSLPKLYADEGQVWQMMTNVLTNALKFTAENGEIAFAASVDRDGWMAISVTDNGIGIAKNDIARIIEPFSQIRSTLTSNNSGVGLGLALVNSLIKLHQGALDIDSAVGKGTTVTLRFPPERVIHQRLAKSA